MHSNTSYLMNRDPSSLEANLSDLGTDDLLNHPRSGQPSQGESGGGYGSIPPPIFSIYSKMKKEDDNKTSKRWQKDAEGIILFTGLFSAALAVLVADSIKDLRPNPQETSALYLGNIIQLLADTNVSRASILSNVAQPPPFRPHTYAILVNSLWFLSLAISITSALLATLLQQWARRYLKVTHTQDIPEDRARVRALFFEGADKFHLLWIADTVPALIHLSLTLFFAGLLILLWNTHRTVFFSVAWWVAIAAVGYAYITLLPIFWPHSLCYGPLPSIAWQAYTIIQYFSLKALSIIRLPVKVKDNRRERLLGRVEKNARKKALSRRSKMDACILDSTLNALDDDYDKEQFFGAIPGFYRSIPKGEFPLSKMFLDNYVLSLNGFLDRTLSSDSIPDRVRSSRLFICLNAANMVADRGLSSQITRRIIDHDSWHEVPTSAEKAYILRRWTRSNNNQSVASGRYIVARIIAKAWKRDDTWMALAMDQLRVSEADLKDYLTHGNSVLLANLIKITDLFFETKFPYSDVLGSISDFGLEDILPDLQRKFCTLWNTLVLGEQSQSSDYILEAIRDIFNALHPDPQATIPVTQDEDHLPSTSSHILCRDPNNRTPHQPTPANTTCQTVPYQSIGITIAEPSINPSTKPSTISFNSDTTLQNGEETVNTSPPITLDTALSSSVPMPVQHTIGTEPPIVPN